MTTPDDPYLALDALYDEVPTVECQGLCWNSCGPVDMSTLERQRIVAAGVVIPPHTKERSRRWAQGEPLHCPALDQYRRCSVYEIRPLICRIWGNGRGQLACPWGCARTGPRLRLEEVMDMVMRSYVIGGHDDDLGMAIDRRILVDAAVKPLLARYVSGDFSVEQELMHAVEQVARRIRAGDDPPDCDG